MVFNSINKLYNTVKTESYNNVLEKAIEQTNSILDNHINSLLRDNNYVFASEPYMDFDCIKRKTLVADTYEGMLKLIEKHKLKGIMYQKQSLKMLKKENESMSNTKTFQEVIRDIKEGEVWEVTKDDYTVKSIEMMSGHIILNSDEDSKEGAFLNINPDVRFKLQRKKYTFTEAFEALEKGKEIESYIMGYKYKYFTDVHPRIYRIFVDGNWRGFTSITLSEIIGDWYING